MRKTASCVCPHPHDGKVMRRTPEVPAGPWLPVPAPETGENRD